MEVKRLFELVVFRSVIFLLEWNIFDDVIVFKIFVDDVEKLWIWL